MAHAVKVIYTVRDNKGKKATAQIGLPTGLSMAEYSEFAQEMAALIDPVISGQIVNVGIAYTADIGSLGLQATPLTSSDVEEKAYFQFLTAGGYSTGVKLPTNYDTNVVSGSDALDQANTDVLAFQDAMIDGITLPVATTTIVPCDSREDDITSLSFAREIFRSSGKRA